VFQPFHVVQDEDHAIAVRELHNRFIQREPIENRRAVKSVSIKHYPYRHFAIFGQLLFSDVALTEMHKHLVNRQAMKPGGESTFPAKASQLAKDLHENVLCQIFSLRGVSYHSKT